MKTIFWLGTGIAIGVVCVRKYSQVRGTLGPEGLNRAVGRLSDSFLDFADAIREGSAEREAELRAALGVDAAEARASLSSHAAGRR
ncbi:hypothetical protein [Arthrobacter sp. 35W]|uniref:hypothetical protein n=1 Tax=Arthrobacter sp. 35W TaxID=1132441 RepID=UPI0003F6A64A|nr:hypothetical protein [Arthrobacter sp. 35W]